MMELAIVLREPGIPSKHKSSACIDYVPALCTHCSWLLPNERFSEVFGLGLGRIYSPMLLGKTSKRERLDEIKVITRCL